MNELDLNSSVDTPINYSTRIPERIPEIDDKPVASSDKNVTLMYNKVTLRKRGDGA